MATYRRPELLCSTSTPPPSTPQRRAADPAYRAGYPPTAADDLDGHALDGPRRHAGRPADYVPPGQFVFDVSGTAKHRLRSHDLLEKFEELRRSDQLDETAARLLREVYV